jgi:hypothetical protein
MAQIIKSAKRFEGSPLPNQKRTLGFIKGIRGTRSG